MDHRTACRNRNRPSRGVGDTYAGCTERRADGVRGGRRRRGEGMPDAGKLTGGVHRRVRPAGNRGRSRRLPTGGVVRRPTALEGVVRHGSWFLHEMLGAFRGGRQARGPALWRVCTNRNSASASASSPSHPICRNRNTTRPGSRRPSLRLPTSTGSDRPRARPGAPPDGPNRRCSGGRCGGGRAARACGSRPAGRRAGRCEPPGRLVGVPPSLPRRCRPGRWVGWLTR